MHYQQINLTKGEVMNVAMRSYVLRNRLERKLQRRIARRRIASIFKTESIHDANKSEITQNGYLDDDIASQLIITTSR